MKSRTSFFNATVLKKDITRFMPIWILYSILLLLWLPGFDSIAYRVRNVIRHTEGVFLLHMLYAAVNVALLFGDQFRTRLCYGQHAFPLRRECWFVTHSIAGLLFSFVPNLVYTLVSMLFLQEYFYVALLWLAVSTLQYLFAFGVSVLCAMAAGNRLGMAALAGLFYTLVYLLKYFVQDIYVAILHGVVWEPEWIDMLIPTLKLSGGDYILMSVQFQPDIIRFQGWIVEDWLYLGIAALTGVIFWICALFLYRKRNLETAGDFLSLQSLKPVFPVVAAVAMETALFSIVYVPLLGLIVGYFGSKMLLERTVRVFRWKHIRWGLLMVGLYIVSIAVTLWDPMGISAYVPKTEQVEAVQCYTNYSRYENESVWITDEAQIEKLTQVHSQLTDYKDYDTDSLIATVYINYRLNSGRLVQREYRVDALSVPGQATGDLLSGWQFVFGTDNWQPFADSVVGIKLQDEEKFSEYGFAEVSIIDPMKLDGLLDAMYKDCNQGTMAQAWAFHRDNDKGEERATVILYDAKGQVLKELTIFRDSENTCAWLDERT